MTWRETLRPIILDVIRKLGPPRRMTSQFRRRAEAALFVAYPYRKRSGRQYRIWRDEIRIQLGLRPRRPRTSSQPSDSRGQRHLFR
jgi:hypothetical protein